MTGNVTSITLSNPVAGQTVQIRFQQDATGGGTCAVPSGAKVDGAINTGADRVSWLILTYSCALQPGKATGFKFLTREQTDATRNLRQNAGYRRSCVTLGIQVKNRKRIFSLRRLISNA